MTFTCLEPYEVKHQDIDTISEFTPDGGYSMSVKLDKKIVDDLKRQIVNQGINSGKVNWDRTMLMTAIGTLMGHCYRQSQSMMDVSDMQAKLHEAASKYADEIMQTVNRYYEAQEAKEKENNGNNA